MYTDLTTAKKNRIKNIKKQQNRCCIYPVSLLHYTLKGIQQDLLPHSSPNLINQGKSPADNSFTQPLLLSSASIMNQQLSFPVRSCPFASNKLSCYQNKQNWKKQKTAKTKTSLLWYPFPANSPFCAVFHIETSPKCYWYYPFIIFLNSCSFLKYEN